MSLANVRPLLGWHYNTAGAATPAEHVSSIHRDHGVKCPVLGSDMSSWGEGVDEMKSVIRCVVECCKSVVAAEKCAFLTSTQPNLDPTAAVNVYIEQ